MEAIGIMQRINELEEDLFMVNKALKKKITSKKGRLALFNLKSLLLDSIRELESEIS